MNRKKLYIIVIFCTISCAFIMLNDWNNFGSNNIEYKKEVNSKINSKEDPKIDNKREDNKRKDKKIVDIKIVVPEKTKDNAIKVESSNEADSNNNNYDESISNSYDKEKDEEYAAVFKVSKNNIMGSLSLIDKGKILIIASKLSPVDYKKIQEFLKVGDEKAIINTIKLLKENLSDKDYARVREVAEKFLNMEIVERQIH